MIVLYFTFGSDPAFPYGRNDYLIAIGKDMRDCIDTYKKAYPNRPGSESLNCADYYTAAEWKETGDRYYKNIRYPKEILVSDTVYGNKPAGFDPIWFFVPAMSSIIYLQEGSGDNLTPEDEKDGNVDYLDYTVFAMSEGEINEEDGGELLLPYMVQEHYKCLADAIPDILDFHYCKMFLNAQILSKTLV